MRRDFQLLQRAFLGTVLLAALCVAAGAQEAEETLPENLPPSPLLREPKSPDELFAAVLMLVDLNRLDLAGRYLQQFIESDPDDELLIKLRNKHGTSEFLKLSRIPQLKAQAEPLLDRLNGAAQRLADDPAYAEALVARLSGNPIQRELAIGELRSLGDAAFPHLFRMLAQPDSDQQSEQIIAALGRMGQPAVLPTVAALHAPQTPMRLAALSALQAIDSQVAVPFLWYPAFAESEPEEIQQAARKTLATILSASEKLASESTSETAVIELRRMVRELYFHQLELPRDDDGNVVYWRWDNNAGTVVQDRMASKRANLLLAERFANQWLSLAPDDAEARQFQLGCQLGVAATDIGRDQPISLSPGTPGQAAMEAGEEAVTSVLEEALAAGQTGTAQAALQILSQIGSERILTSSLGRKSPVLAALDYPDPRVQFAAANTILRQDPTQPFRGADRVVSILQRAISGSEQSKALIIDADVSRAELTSGYLSDLGYAPVMVRTGKEGFVAAANTSGIDLVVIHINCIRWDLTPTIANFRADARTAYLPIVLYGPEDITDVESKYGRRDALAFPEASSRIWNGTLPPGGRLEPILTTTRQRLQRLILRNQPMAFVAESGAASDFFYQIRPFLNDVKQTQLTENERAKNLSTALRWLAHLSQAETTSVFDLSPLESALTILSDEPEYASMALAALSGIASTIVQQKLAVAAGNTQALPAIRSQAANHLALHLQRHGVMLTSDDIRDLEIAWRKESDELVATAIAEVLELLRTE